MSGGVVRAGTAPASGEELAGGGWEDPGPSVSAGSSRLPGGGAGGGPWLPAPQGPDTDSPDCGCQTGGAECWRRAAPSGGPEGEGPTPSFSCSQSYQPPPSLRPGSWPQCGPAPGSPCHFSPLSPLSHQQSSYQIFFSWRDFSGPS